jgi:hypothetical protein
MSATTSLLEAVHAVQKEAPTLPKDKTNPHYGSKYTGLDTIVETVGPLLNKHGLVWVSLPSGTRDEPTLAYRLMHVESGQAIEGEMPLLLDKASAQAMGSAITYTRRYSLCAVLNLVADDDDDGQAAGTTGLSQSSPGRAGRPSDAQKKLIEKLVKEKGASVAQLQIILDTIGANVQVEDGWMDKLTGGRDGTGSLLITFLKENPLPSLEHPTDVPADDDGFEHPPQAPLEILG